MKELLPIMSPPAGERRRRFVGDRIRFSLSDSMCRPLPDGWQARLRTNLGRAEVLREEIIHAHTRKLPLADASWRDVPMTKNRHEWEVELPLIEVGYFKAKAYAIDLQGWQHWPDGPDIGISVHPNICRTANTVYCAFTRMFGPTKELVSTQDEKLETQLRHLDQQGYTVIPPSGKLRDLIREIPHIVETIGCRILHLLPVNPTPTTYARFGRFGSPYASLDLTAIDPALVEFDRRTTGVDQFIELTYAAHGKGARVFLDLVINHTGWGATLQEKNPGWYLRDSRGNFVSPGAWGVVWEDLAELEHRHIELSDELAKVFLVWCRRGVDGFRCDAGYKVPVRTWRYIIARVRQEFPETVFLLEGLGGAWEATENLLTDGGMQWAYSELFQNHSGQEVAEYLDHSLKQSERVGDLLHYSETHDNNRLAARGRAWSLLRNRLCALASVNGGYGFTCGVEWLATEKVNVHSSRGLAWGSHDNLIPELAHLNKLLADHPCFFDGAKLTRLSGVDSPVYALHRESEEGRDRVLVVANNDIEKPHTLMLVEGASVELDNLKCDLLGQPFPELEASADGKLVLTLEPGAVFCLSDSAKPRGLSGDDYRLVRTQAAWAMTALSRRFAAEDIGPCDWHALANLVKLDPRNFLASLSHLDPKQARVDLWAALEKADAEKRFPQVVTWSLLDRKRITLVPPGHWLLLHDDTPFRVTLSLDDGNHPQHLQSIPIQDGHVACFAPRQTPADAELILERYAKEDQRVRAAIRYLSPLPATIHSPTRRSYSDELVLLSNGRGGMARMCADLGRITSKYDCVLGANLHPSLPVDRHVFVKRVRVWANADGFTTQLNGENLFSFEGGPPARWRFITNAGDGRSVEIQLNADMLPQHNTTVLHFHRPESAPSIGKELPTACDVRLTVRVDIEDRNFHSETHRNGGAEYHFATNTHSLNGRSGFAFTPATDRQLRVFADAGRYHPAEEWCENIPHPVEQTRGQVAVGDAFSPGWFDLPLTKGASVTMVITTEVNDPSASELQMSNPRLETPSPTDPFGQRLAHAASAFVVRRDNSKTVIAGYPWFLDWGRDSLICARGLLAAGMVDDVEQLLVTFARFEQNGTLPNSIQGDNASNRDTSDAPLWFGMVCEEIAALKGIHFYHTRVDPRGRTIADILRSIAVNYKAGTPNGIRMDTTCGLIWSPSHFTWMDTNYPAATPREGYPVEIQALWVRLLRQLGRIKAETEGESWNELADRSEASLNNLYWLEDRGYLADLLVAEAQQPACSSLRDNSLRSNQLLAVSFGLIKDERAQRCVDAALRYLVVPGALRSLAPLQVSPPLPIYSHDRRLLNNPTEPYWGHYEGDEDTQRKLAYHNGTAWTWTFPIFCEALARAWNFSPAAVATATAYLGSMDRLMMQGCLGHVPEILDGDTPHQQRGCDAQAWGATEALRVWKLLHDLR